MVSDLGRGLPEGRAENFHVFLQNFNAFVPEEEDLDAKIDLVALGRFLKDNREYLDSSHPYTPEYIQKFDRIIELVENKNNSMTNAIWTLVDRCFKRTKEEMPLGQMKNVIHDYSIDKLAHAGSDLPLIKIIVANASIQDLGRLAQTSSVWNEVASEEMVRRINVDNLPLRDMGMQDIYTVLQFLEKNGAKLKCLNLRGIETPYPRSERGISVWKDIASNMNALKTIWKLVSCCPNVTSLTVEKMPAKHTNFLIAMLALFKGQPLTSLRLLECDAIDRSSLEHLEMMQLTDVEFTAEPENTDIAQRLHFAVCCRALVSKENLMTEEQAAAIPIMTLRMLKQDGIPLLQSKLITPEEAALFHNTNIKALFSEEGQEALRSKLLTANDIADLPDEYAIPLLSHNGIVALKNKLITLKQVASMPSAAHIAALLSNEGLEALGDCRITPEEAATLPTDSHLKLLVSKNGQKALKEQLITVAQARDLEVNRLEELLSDKRLEV